MAGIVDVRYLADIAQVIVDLTHEALVGTAGGQTGVQWIGHASPPDDCCDYLNVVYTGFRPTQPGTLAPPPQGLPIEKCNEVGYAAEVAVTVARPYGAAVQTRRRTPIPGPEDEEAMAVAVLQDATALMHRALPSYAENMKASLPWRWPGNMTVSAGRLTPFSQGGCSGWVLSFALLLPLVPPTL